jgi:hypothetical protein
MCALANQNFPAPVLPITINFLSLTQFPVALNPWIHYPSKPKNGFKSFGDFGIAKFIIPLFFNKILRLPVLILERPLDSFSLFFGTRRFITAFTRAL